MNAIIGQIYMQTKELDGFPYNRVGEKWFVYNIQGKYTVLKNDGVGLGVSEEELKEHFKLVEKDDGYEDHEDDYEDDYDEDWDGEYDGDWDGEYDGGCDDEEESHYDEVVDRSENRKSSKFNQFLRKIGLKKN